jgi:hypothetical protein
VVVIEELSEGQDRRGKQPKDCRWADTVSLQYPILLFGLGCVLCRYLR